MTRDDWAGRMWRKAVPARVRRGLFAARQGAARVGKEALARLYRGGPVPLWAVTALRAALHDRDALLPPGGDSITDGSALANPYLRERLAGRELGRWSLSAAALNYLEGRVCDRKPAAILEFGSGISTLCLARYMVELHGENGGPYVFSIDQDSQFLGETAELLEAGGLAAYARLCHAPLARQNVLGQTTTCYALSDELLQGLFGSVRPDFVLIDGPAADEGRFGTLPLALRYIRPGAWFYLDDALRDDELADAALWRRTSYLDVRGFWLHGKGLLIGRIREA